jgi:Protein of unknown function (DUF1592)/Protein of unknown function (DUF1588)/Protein of unknown function (DUF1587)/Protein of unknown function (DUF1585)/Protein of unknown function (DUF1595)/Planctomycete cytochrome C
MRCWLLVFVLGTTASAAPYEATFSQYCFTCHNQKLKTGGLALDTLDLKQPGENADVWEKVIRKMRLGMMPPKGAPRPSDQTYHEVIGWLEGSLDRAAAAQPWAGRPALHRLNRAEYSNAIRDLLDLDIDAAALLPPDDSAYGFDNISEALGLSPALQEHYLSAAIRIGALAVGDRKIAAGGETWRIPSGLSQDEHLEGLPLGTTGGFQVRYNFPLDGEYAFQARLFRTNLNIMRGLEAPRQVEFSLDDKRILLTTIGGPAELANLFTNPTDTGDAVDARLRVRVPVKAGPHVLTVAFLEDSMPSAAEPARLQPYIRSSTDNFDWTGHPHLQVVSVAGPFHATGAGDTPSRRRIFTCRPASKVQEEPCAKRIVATLLRRAYRQPASDAEVNRAMQFYETGEREGGFEAGIEFALQRTLASPKFIFRAERDAAGAPPGSMHAVGDFELASRLSFFLWSSIPDDSLLEHAGAGQLRRPEAFEREVRRMLSDPKASALLGNFAAQWLQLRNLKNVQPNSDKFPDFDDNLRQGFRRETEMLFESVLREDRSVLDLMTADYTFVNERLARHYGIPDIYGSRFRRVAIHDDARKGLLGQGSILALTSHAERTSPVVRGKWILENLLGTPVPPPPPDVPALKENQDGEKPRTMREQMAEHRANAACATCHKMMDPVGFALENFDAVGAWRAVDAGVPIDATGELADGTRVDGVVTLRAALLKNPEAFVTAFTEKLLTYGLGRGLDYRDMPAVRSIVKGAARDNYKMSALILGVTRSTPFQMRMTAAALTQTPERESIETVRSR